MNLFGIEIQLVYFSKKHVTNLLKNKERLEAYSFLENKTGWGNFKINEYINKIERKYKITPEEILKAREETINKQRELDKIVERSRGKMIAMNTLGTIQ